MATINFAESEYGKQTYKPGMNLYSPEQQADYDAAHTALVNNPDYMKTEAQKAYDKAYADAMSGTGGLPGNKDYATTQANTAFNATPYGVQQRAQLTSEQDARKTAQEERHQTLLAERQASGLIGTPVDNQPVVRQGTGHGTDPGTNAATGTAPAEDTTVAGRVQSIIAQNSPLMQQAAANANQQSNDRGLINSSIASGAAQGAVMDRATGIATQDAAAATQRLRDATQQGYTQSNMGLQQTFDLQKMQTAQGYVQANMATGQTFDIAKMDKQAAITLSQMSQQQINDLSKLATLQGYNVQNMTQQQINDMAKMVTAQGYNIANMSTQAEIDLLKMDKTFTQADRTAQEKFGYDKALIQMQRDSSKEIATIEAQYRSLTQASASATSLANKAADNINAILTNKDLVDYKDAAGVTHSAKQDAIDIVTTNYANSMKLIAAMAGDPDLSNLLDQVFSVG